LQWEKPRRARSRPPAERCRASRSLDPGSPARRGLFSRGAHGQQQYLAAPTIPTGPRSDGSRGARRMAGAKSGPRPPRNLRPPGGLPPARQKRYRTHMGELRGTPQPSPRTHPTQGGSERVAPPQGSRGRVGAPGRRPARRRSSSARQLHQNRLAERLRRGTGAGPVPAAPPTYLGRPVRSILALNSGGASHHPPAPPPGSSPAATTRLAGKQGLAYGARRPEAAIRGLADDPYSHPLLPQDVPHPVRRHGISHMRAPRDVTNASTTRVDDRRRGSQTVARIGDSLGAERVGCAAGSDRLVGLPARGLHSRWDEVAMKLATREDC